MNLTTLISEFSNILKLRFVLDDHVLHASYTSKFALLFLCERFAALLRVLSRHEQRDRTMFCMSNKLHECTLLQTRDTC